MEKSSRKPYGTTQIPINYGFPREVRYIFLKTYSYLEFFGFFSEPWRKVLENRVQQLEPLPIMVLLLEAAGPCFITFCVRS